LTERPPRVIFLIGIEGPNAQLKSPGMVFGTGNSGINGMPNWTTPYWERHHKPEVRIQLAFSRLRAHLQGVDITWLVHEKEIFLITPHGTKFPGHVHPPGLVITVIIVASFPVPTIIERTVEPGTA